MAVLEGMGWSRKQWVARAPFPLTPTQWLPKPATNQFPHTRRTLRVMWSLGEREQLLLPRLQVHGTGCANQRSKMVHPLPKGEGRGEGEGTVKISIHAVDGEGQFHNRPSRREGAVERTV